MPLIIPFRNLPAFKETVVLDGETFIFSFQYNTRGDYWTMDISDKNQVLLMAGLKVVLGYELIQRYGTREQPAGEIYPIDVTETIERIGRNDLPAPVEMTYITEDELAGVA